MNSCFGGLIGSVDGQADKNVVCHDLVQSAAGKEGINGIIILDGIFLFRSTSLRAFFFLFFASPPFFSVAISSVKFFPGIRRDECTVSQRCYNDFTIESSLCKWNSARL